MSEADLLEEIEDLKKDRQVLYELSNRMRDEAVEWKKKFDNAYHPLPAPPIGTCLLWGTPVHGYRGYKDAWGRSYFTLGVALMQVTEDLRNDLEFGSSFCQPEGIFLLL